MSSWRQRWQSFLDGRRRSNDREGAAPIPNREGDADHAEAAAEPAATVAVVRASSYPAAQYQQQHHYRGAPASAANYVNRSLDHHTNSQNVQLGSISLVARGAGPNGHIQQVVLERQVDGRIAIRSMNQFRPSGPAFDPNVLPAYPYKVASSMSQDRRSCTICLTDFQDGDQVRLLPCLHQYHVQCIDPWLLQHCECPVCQQDIRKLCQQGNILSTETS